MCEMDEFDEEIRRGAEEWGRMMESEEKRSGAGGEEEGRKPKVITSPVKPSAKEVEEHMATHIPFRSWCAHCVAGKSKSNPHFKGTEERTSVPEISVDYMYMSIGNSDEQIGMPILVAKDRKTNWTMAGVVPSKGKCAHAVRRMEGMLDILGYRKYILKSDQEPAIMELKEQVRMSREEEVIMEESLVEDSRSNGLIERAIQGVQDQIRTLKSALESRLGKEVSAEHPALPWLIMHAANLLNRYHKGQDGCTAYRRLKGKDFEQGVAEFGEEIWYMPPGIVGKDKLDVRWKEGVWLGN